MRPVIPLAASVVLAAFPALAQVSGTDTTRSREDRAAFPDPTLPQANTYIPQVRQKVSTPLSELVDEEDSRTGATPEEVAAFLDLEPVAADTLAQEAAGGDEGAQNQAE